MGQQTINNGDTGLDVRNKLNSNFTELYTGKDSVTVNTYADLPDPTTVANQRYWVLTSTGVYLINRRNAGAYYSNGTVWSWLGNNPTTADQIGNVPSGSVTATDVQGAIDQLDTGKEPARPSGIATITLPGGRGVFEHQETVSAIDVLPTYRISLSLASTTDNDETDVETSDIRSFGAVAGTDQITISATFTDQSSGPIKFNWEAR